MSISKQIQLIAKLKELFMMDQADLDFGIYRIMHARHDEIESFLQHDLLPTIRQTLQANGKNEAAKQELDELTKTLTSAGMNPDESPKVQELKALLGDGANASLEKDEEDIFSHLHTFFSRYYDGGDFMSLRRYRQETYSPLPMNGEEVKLHWANADQYYIKSAENFTHYVFNIGDGDHKKHIRFELVQASTEQNNKKENSDKERRFMLDENQPLSQRSDAEGDTLILHFSYQPDNKKRKQKDLNTQTIETIQKLSNEAPATASLSNWQDWQAALLTPMPTEKNQSRTALEKYLTDYTAKNSFDYFIHKDLGGFLRRELDFFIKNELLLLDDIIPTLDVNDDGAAADNTGDTSLASQLLSNERSLRKVAAFKRIAQKLIAFLAQLEDFQKKLWLKKKFVLESNYCFTLDRVPTGFYAEIAANSVQVQEWRDLGVLADDVSEINADFLQQQPYLMVDTGHFDADFKQRLLAEVEDLDQQTDGLLIHSENFQALNLMQERYREQVKCISIDPPYNTGGGDFSYKDSYQHSSWMSMMKDRIILASSLKHDDYLFFTCADDNEQTHLRMLMKLIFGEKHLLPSAYWEKVYSSRMDALGLSEDHDHIVIAGSGVCKVPFEQNTRQFTEFDEIKKKKYRRRSVRKEGSNSRRQDRPNLYYPLDAPDGSLLYPLKPDGSEGCWRWNSKTHSEREKDGVIEWIKTDGSWQVYVKQYLSDNATRPPSTLWKHNIVGHNHEATEIVKDLFSEKVFASPKPPRLFEYMLKIAGCVNNDLILDYFAGSGTTGHAVISSNREDNGSRKYILVEMGEYFDTVLMPRIKKVVYAENWKSGKPVTDKDDNYNGISHSFKYLRLESYEDVLDNLQLTRTQAQGELLTSDNHKQLKEDYLLHYMLDVESKDSLFNAKLFVDPFNAHMRIVRNNETREQAIDLVETFNYLLGLTVQATRKQQGLVEVVGTNPQGQSVHIVWRNQHDIDNDALDEWFRKQSYNTRDTEFDLIYVNGDNNLPNLRTGEESWKVQLIEEAFQSLMFDTRDV